MTKENHIRLELKARAGVQYFELTPWNRDGEGSVYWWDGGIVVDGIYYDSLIHWHDYRGEIHYRSQL